MKKCIGVITLILLSIASHADSVWTGNAAVGGISEFPGRSDVYRATSNSFPAGTVLEITNPKGGKTTFVTVIGRLESPGVFILIESNAAEAIDLPSDHVLPVRVRPVESIEEALDPVVHGDAVTEDSDYNPTAGLDEESLEPRTAVVDVEDEPEIEEEFVIATEAEEEGLATPVPSLVDAEKDSEKMEQADDFESLEIEEAGDLEIPEYVTAGAKPETIYTYVIDEEDEEEAVEIDEVPEIVDEYVYEAPIEEPPVEPSAEVEKSESDEGKGGGKVYFLSPSDLRPPPAIESEDDEVVSATVLENIEAEEDLPAEAASNEDEEFLDIQLISAVPGGGSSYIQIGAYENRSILEDTARRVKNDGLPYPLSIASGVRDGRTVYKLLIGPLRPAEKGVVLRTLKSSAYPDAFPYEP